MYRRSPGNEIIGVLIDFDLAIISEGQSSNTERAGTMPFMALDVLKSITTSSLQQHLYRYDAESFLWVAIWVCGTFEHGKERENSPFKVWTQGDADHCLGRKLVFLTRKDSPWSGDYTAKAKILRGMRIHLWEEEVERVKQADRVEEAGGEVESEVPENPKTIYEGINTKLLSVLRKQLGEQRMNVD
jgi:Fungal protein kinase